MNRFLGRKDQAEAEQSALPDLPIEFGMAVWTSVLMWFLFILSLIGIVLTLIYADNGENRFIGLAGAGFMGLLSCLALIESRSKIRITESTLTYKQLVGGFELLLASIKSAHLAGGQLIINTGVKHKIGIPPYFKGRAQLLKILQTLPK